MPKCLTSAADSGANWYEQFAQHMKLRRAEFAMSYITRSGRLDLERLRRVSPRFVAAYGGGEGQTMMGVAPALSIEAAGEQSGQDSRPSAA